MTVNLLHCLTSLATAVRRTENVEEGVGEEITVLVAGVALQHVHVVTRHVHVLHVVVAQQSNSPSSPL